MKKSELKSGMMTVVAGYPSEKQVVLLDTPEGDSLANVMAKNFGNECGARLHDHFSLNHFYEDLTTATHVGNIVKVYGVFGNLIWEREEEVRNNFDSVKVGNTYRVSGKDNNTSLITITDIETGALKGHGFDIRGKFVKEIHFSRLASLIYGRTFEPAAQEDINNAFIKQAKSKYELGDMVVSLNSGAKYPVESGYKFRYNRKSGELDLDTDGTGIYFPVFKNGEWSDAYRTELVKK